MKADSSMLLRMVFVHLCSSIRPISNKFSAIRRKTESGVEGLIFLSIISGDMYSGWSDNIPLLYGSINVNFS